MTLISPLLTSLLVLSAVISVEAVSPSASAPVSSNHEATNLATSEQSVLVVFPTMNGLAASADEVQAAARLNRAPAHPIALLRIN